jgi:asparagine synthase (glutamine-hydrolysing)
MSSIFGMIRSGGQPVDLKGLHQMERALNHWEADASHCWTEEEVGLGHLMLYNTPESLNERLPLIRYESQLTITSDARLDNREELFDQLSIHAADRKTFTDSALILRVYEKFGHECVKHLIGDFAFAIWDKKNKQLFCARDHMGVKPFFYYLDPECFLLASEKKGILAIPGLNTVINQQFLFNQIFSPVQQAENTTVYQQIHRLAPAHCLVLDVDQWKVSCRRYWALDPFTEIKLPSKKDYLEGLKWYFDEAIKCRVRSAYQVGSELSGGLDSSPIVAAACSAAGREKITTFSNTLSSDINDEISLGKSERPFIEEVLRWNGITDAVMVTEHIFNHIEEELNFGLRLNDGPEMWNPVWQMPMKSEARKRNVRTMLSGFSGDQMVTDKGKGIYIDEYCHKNLIAHLSGAKDFRDFLRRISPGLPWQMRYAFQYFQSAFQYYFHRGGRPGLINSLKAFDVPYKYWSKRNEHLWKGDYYKGYLKSYRHNLKAKVSKPMVSLRMEAETRHGIHFRTEPRFPMADIRLMQYYLSIPDKLKYEGQLTRPFWREAVSDYLPDMIIKKDSKTADMAPFMTTPEKIQQKRDFLKEVLEQSGNQNQPLIIKDKSWITINHLETIWWLKQNFR